jgi:hypothetical protein
VLLEPVRLVAKLRTMTSQTALFVGALAAVIAWWATYTLLGGKLLAHSPFMPRTWASTWRSFVAGIVAVAFLVLAGSLGSTP